MPRAPISTAQAHRPAAARYIHLPHLVHPKQEAAAVPTIEPTAESAKKVWKQQCMELALRA